MTTIAGFFHLPNTPTRLHQSLKLLTVSLALIAAGCGKSGKPLAQTTIASTGITVTLLAPDAKHHFHYSVSDAAGHRLDRFLGPVRISLPVRSQVSDEGAGRFRISWGSGSETAWTLIDALSRKVISDSNAANQAQSF